MGKVCYKTHQAQKKAHNIGRALRRKQWEKFVIKPTKPKKKPKIQRRAFRRKQW